GPEYPDTAAPPPGSSEPEYNLRIDVAAAQVVFNDSPIALWQVPRNVYRQAIVSWAELETKVRLAGQLGAYLYRARDDVRQRAARHGVDIGETYIVGDSPLVLLTALQSSFEPDPSSSHYDLRPAPTIDDDGTYDH